MDFVVNLLGFPEVKECWKSVKNWQSYCHEFGVLLFWDTVYIDRYNNCGKLLCKYTIYFYL